MCSPTICGQPDVTKILLNAAQGRVRIILDNAALHMDEEDGQATRQLESQFTDRFQQQKKAPADIVRGSFGRELHDSVHC